ncbi:MAG TPA: hypothetical protein VE081_07460, partial [Sporichthyaceae bacterium]|nr:hypothetical protein [Sporichthyaceae bacterium]
IRFEAIGPYEAWPDHRSIQGNNRPMLEPTMDAMPQTLIFSPAPSSYLWHGCGVTRAGHIPGEPWVVAVDEDCSLDPDGARELAAQLLAAADLAEALRLATDDAL